MPPIASPAMSRRQFLGSATTAIATAAALHGVALNAADATSAVGSMRPQNAFTYRFTIGDIEAWPIGAGQMLFKEGLNLTSPAADRPAMRDNLIAHGERTDALPLYVNILVVKSGNEI